MSDETRKGQPEITFRDAAAGEADPCAVYPRVPGIDCRLFQLGDGGVPSDTYRAALQQLLSYETRQRDDFLGYQANQKLDYKGLAAYLDYHVNNIGDPFQSGNFTVNAKWMERAVLDYYARLWRARWPSNAKDPESYWGYVLSMGSSEGNLFGLWNGRDYLAGKALLEEPSADARAREQSLHGRPRAPRRLVWRQAAAPADSPNAYTPVAFYSEDTHYSIIKAMRVLAIPTFYELGTRLYPNENPLGGPWPEEVPSVDGGAGPGTIDVAKLAVLVEFFAERGYPILVCFNYGTTFKGAYDDVEQAGHALMPIFERYGLDRRRVEWERGKFDWRTGFWFHVDGALGAAFMPYLEAAHAQGQFPTRGPNFDFRLPFVHSISMSGHKWIGAPWPCGLYMTKIKYQLRPPDNPAYIGSLDTTLAGSRNGFSAMLLWDYHARHGFAWQSAKAIETQKLAAYAYDQLKKLEARLRMDLWVERSPLSLTVRFRACNAALVFKYSLSGEALYVGGQERAYNHVFAMESATRERLDRLMADLAKPGAFPPQEELLAAEPATPEQQVSAGGQPLALVPHFGRGWR